MGPAASSQYTGEVDSQKKKPASNKPTFPTRQEQEARKRHEERKNWVMNHQQESMGERYTSLKGQASWYTQEVRALRFFEPENKDTDLACMVLPIVDWAIEYNKLSTHPVVEILPGLEVPYSGSRQVRGQFPLRPTLEESSSTDVWTRSQAMWIYLCSILQFFENEMAIWEGALFGGKTCQSSALVLHIMDLVNPGLLEHFRVEWTSIVGSTPWLAAREHMTKEELEWFYNELTPDVSSELEVAMEEVYIRACEDATRRECGNQPVPQSRAEEGQIQDSLGLPPQSTQGPTDPQQPPLPATGPDEWPHKFVPGSDWALITESEPGPGVDAALLYVTSAELDKLDGELGIDDVQDQDILEPQKLLWKPVVGDALATPLHNVKSVVNPFVELAPAEVTSCGKGRGQTINEKLKALSTMGPAASSQYTREVDSRKKKLASKQPTFPTREEQEARKRCEESKN